MAIDIENNSINNNVRLKVTALSNSRSQLWKMVKRDIFIASLNHARQLMEFNKFDEAHRFYLEAIENYKIFLTLDEFKNNIAFVKKIKEKIVSTYNNVGLAQNEMGQFNETLQLYKNIIAAYPEINKQLMYDALQGAYRGLGHIAIENSQFILAKKYFNTIHSLRKEANPNYSGEYYNDYVLFLLNERIKYGTRAPKYTQKIFVIYIKRWESQATIPQSLNIKMFEKDIFSKISYKPYKTFIQTVYSINSSGNKYILKNNLSASERDTLIEAMISVNYNKKGERVVKTRELTEYEINRDKQNYAFLKLVVEAFSQGNLSLQMTYNTIAAACTRVQVGTDNFPENTSIRPYPSELIFSNIDKYDHITWHFPAIVAGQWVGNGGVRNNPLIPFYFDSTIRGHVMMPVKKNVGGTLVHEYLHTIEQSTGYKLLHLTEEQMRKNRPGWNPNPKFPMDFQYAHTFFQNEIPLQFIPGNKYGNITGWNKFSWKTIYPFRFKKSIFDRVMSLNTQISPENIRQSAKIFNQAQKLKNVRKIDHAALLYKKAVELNPYNYQALKELAYYELGKRNTIAAIKYFNEYLNVFQDEGEYYQSGMQFLDINDNEHALTFFKQGYTLNRNPAFLHYILSAYQRSGNTEAAQEYFTRIAKLMVQQKPSGKVILPASYSAVISNGGNPNARLEHISGDFSIGYWTNIEDSLRWQLNITRAGRFKIEIIFACPQDQAGSRMELEAGGQKMRFTINATQAWYNFKTVTIPGFMTLNTGKQRVTLRGITKKIAAFINLRQIRFIPVGE